MRSVRACCRYCDRAPAELTFEDVRRYQLHLTQSGLAPASINGAMVALRFFFRVTLKRPEAVDYIPIVREPQRLPVVLTPAEVASLLESAPGLKWRTALSVGYGAGLRASEVVGLKVGDIDSERMRIRVSERLVLNLTAHRTAGLRDMLAQAPDFALTAVVHALAVATFYPHERASCLDLKIVSAWLGSPAPGIEESPAGLALAARHEAWAERLPRAAADAWGFVAALSGADLLALLAHCASLSVNALRNPLDRRPLALTHADTLARDVGLDMTAYWSVSGRS